MYCNNCGNQIDDNAVVCIHCGAPTPNAMQQQQNQQPAKSNETNTLAIVGFIFAFFIPLVGLICSCIGLKRAKNELGGNQKSLAIAGIIISAIVMVIEIIVIAIYASLFLSLIFGIGEAAGA